MAAKQKDGTKKISGGKRPTLQAICGDELKTDMEDLARMSRKTVSEILCALCIEFVKANRRRIDSFRRSASQPLKMPKFDVEKKIATPTTNADGDGDSGKGGVDGD